MTFNASNVIAKKKKKKKKKSIKVVKPYSVEIWFRLMK